MNVWRLLIACSLLTTACQPGPAENPKGEGSSGKPGTGPNVTKGGENELPCSADVARSLSPKQVEALKLIADGSASAAETALYDLLRERPSDRVAAVFLPAARTDAAELRRKASQQSSRLRPLSLPAGTPQAAAKPGAGFKIEKSNKPVTEASAFEYFQSKGMPEAVDFVPPEEVGQQLGDLPFSMAFKSNGAQVARYQDSVLALGTTEAGFRAVLLEPAIVAVYPEANKPSNEATLFPEVNYATVVGSMLIAQISHSGGGELQPDAFVIAYDLETNKVKWTSQRGVGNSHGPAASATHYFTSFMGQDGTSTLQVLDLANGKLVAEYPLPSPASWLFVDGDSLIVWAPTGERLAIPTQGKALPPKFGETVLAAEPILPKLSETRRCHLENAAKAVDARDEIALRTAVDGLPKDSSSRRAAQGALDFIEARKTGTKGIDLTEVTPKKGVYVPTAKTRDLPNPTPLNVKIQLTKEAPLSGEKPLMGAVIGVHPELRSDLFPSAYGAMSLYGAFGVGEDTLLNYGNRYLATVSDNEVKQIIDLAFLTEDPAALGTESAAVSFLGRHGDLLIATVGTPIGADGSTAYIAAIDPKTATVVWRTDAGLANYSILWFTDYAIALFQKQKKTEIVLLRMEDGKTIHSIAPKDPPTELSWDYRGAFFAGANGDRQYYFVK